MTRRVKRIVSKQVWDQTSPYSKAEYRTEEELLDAACSFDSYVETHGTHVAGIAAGGGFDTPYQGVANESEMILVATTMQNSDIVDGVDYIFRESEKQGRPCVVNLSLGDGVGGHDGTNFYGYNVGPNGRTGKNHHGCHGKF